jgi:hypothetical protein
MNKNKEASSVILSALREERAKQLDVRKLGKDKRWRKVKSAKSVAIGDKLRFGIEPSFTYLTLQPGHSKALKFYQENKLAIGELLLPPQ